MLYLDKASFSVLSKVNPLFLKERNIDTANIFFTVPENQVSELSAEYQFIEQLFAFGDSWKNTFERLGFGNNLTLENEIYIKDHKTAIVTIYTETGSISYRVILAGKKLRFEILFDILEFD